MEPRDCESDWDGTSYERRVEILDLTIHGMRRQCRRSADQIIAEHGLSKTFSNVFFLERAVGAALQRASKQLEREAEGEFSAGHRDNSVKAAAAPPPKGSPISDLFEDWWKEARLAGRTPSTYENYRSTIRAFIAHLGHQDAQLVTPDDVVRFKDRRLSTPSARTGQPPSAKTVKDGDLSALKTIFGWAVTNRRLANNPAAGITIKLGKKTKLRSKSFSDDEASSILTAATNYQSNSEAPRTRAAKRWVPWLCAFTGARVGEVAQLRKEDLRLEGNLWIVRITPEAGPIKTNEAREVVLHEQLVELGFPEFVRGAEAGHLFLRPGKDGEIRGPLRGLKNRLAEFARSIVRDPNVAPNHGWRHRFKTVGMNAGIATRVLDEIQGHAAKSVGDTYGEVSLAAQANAMRLFPRIDLPLSTSRLA